jgi:branched-chain amino acid transport system permease protein
MTGAAEMTPKTYRMIFPFLLPAVLGALLAVLPSCGYTYLILLLTKIFMYVILALSWTMFSGPTGKISLATSAFFGAGVYTAAVLSLKLPLWAVVCFGGLSGLCLGLVVGALTLRLRGIYFVMFTFGLVELLLNFILWWEVSITGTTGRIVASVGTTTIYYYLLCIILILCLTIYLLGRSRYGLALRSLGTSEEAAAHLGVNVTALKVTVFALSSFFMGATGAVMAPRWTYIDPKIAFNPLLSFLPVLMAIFGGISKSYGPIIGAAFFTLLEEFLITRFPYHYMLIFGMVMVFTILYLPGGLVELLDKLRSKLTVRNNANS